MAHSVAIRHLSSSLIMVLVIIHGSKQSYDIEANPFVGAFALSPTILMPPQGPLEYSSSSPRTTKTPDKAREGINLGDNCETLSIRIRSLGKSDIAAVSLMLASEIMEQKKQTQYKLDNHGQATQSTSSDKNSRLHNHSYDLREPQGYTASTSTNNNHNYWKQCKEHAKLTRLQAELETELLYRLEAIQEGKRIFQQSTLFHEYVMGDSASPSVRHRNESAEKFYAKLNLHNDKINELSMQQNSRKHFLRHDCHDPQERILTSPQVHHKTDPNSHPLWTHQLNICRWLWHHDTFRSKVQRAVQYSFAGSSLNHVAGQHHHDHHALDCWRGHDMNLTPTNIRWLLQAMFVAEIVSPSSRDNNIEESDDQALKSLSGNNARWMTSSTPIVVGYCELVQMPYLKSSPTVLRDDVDDRECNACQYIGNIQKYQNKILQMRLSCRHSGLHHAHSQQQLQMPLLRPTILNLVISPTSRRCGIATRLVTTAQRYIQEIWDESSLYLHVDANNHPAQNLYRRLGFDAISELSYPRNYA